ncbi:NADH-quinone oxidoreductase subunit M [Nakamurella leprariae]|uniref:NADH-quinone oxidoreductase subunit M n=1 Tax=Nakamurella leprariae TaxID=2803911 RepID=A0A939C0P0_9ACTN|nr:NADH-quinone oxidoreductase subunit M [Nakamurella leprariae]MBM9466239.1 NADH-quinone oxidoreductase subunit M [Nakamurella leprariae]
MDQVPFPLVMLVVPAVGAAVVGLLAARGAPARATKQLALGFSLVELVLAVLSWIGFRNWQTSGGGSEGALFAQTTSFDWIPAFGVRFSLGLDGFSLVMIALIAVLVPIVLLASWEERLPQGRTFGGYFALLLALQSAMVGVFAATDVFLFYVMFEVMLIPMYFLVGGFGGPRRQAAAMKFFLYSLLGGLLMLASVIGLYVASGRVLAEQGRSGTLDFATLREIADQIPLSSQLWIFAGFAIAFAIKAPLVPLHTWLPDAGAEAPTGTGVLLVGVLDKVGTFGFLRICLPLLPAASRELAWLLLLLAVLGVLYGAVVAAGQTDLKRFVTWTSIAHFGFIALGVFAFTTTAISGAVLYMVNHGIATGLLFLLVGMLVSRGGSRSVTDYGGVWKVAPVLGGLFLLASLATVAVPGTNSFVSEFLVLIGSFPRIPVWTVLATVGIVLAAVYMLWVFQRVMTGPVRGSAVLLDEPTGDLPAGPGSEPEPVPPAPPAAGGTAVAVRPVSTAAATSGGRHRTEASARRFRFGDLRAREIAILSPLVALVLLLGFYPQPVLDVINPTAQRTVVDVGVTDLPAPLGGTR